MECIFHCFLVVEGTRIQLATLLLSWRFDTWDGVASIQMQQNSVHFARLIVIIIAASVEWLVENGTNLKMAPSYNIDIDFFCVCCCCLLLYSFRPSMTVSGCNDNGRSVKVNQSYYLEGDQSQSRRNPRQTQCDKKKSCFNVPPSRKHCNRFPVKLASWTYSGITLDIKVVSLWRTS